MKQSPTLSIGRRRLGNLFALHLLVLLLFAIDGRTQVEVAVVLPFENQSRDPKLEWVGESFVEVLSTHLNSSRLLMVDRRERSAAFDSLGIPSARILSNATIYKAAEVLDTDRVVMGSYIIQDGVLTATAQVLTMNGPVLSKPFSETGPLENLLTIQAAMAWQIQRFLRPEYPYSKAEYVADRTSIVNVKLEAFENYIRGLLASTKGAQIQLFRSADRIDPRFTKPAFELGMLYFRDRDFQTSILWLTKLRRSDPDFLEANYFLGVAYLNLGQYDRSAAAFRVIEPNLPLNEVYNNLAIALARRGQPGALQYFEKAYNSDPTDADFGFNLGYSYWQRGEYAEAVTYLTPAVEKLNLHAARAVLVDCLKKLGRPDEANAQAARLPGSFTPAAAQLTNLERPKNKHDAVSFRQLIRLLQIQEELQHSKYSDTDHAGLHFQKAMQNAANGLEQEAVEELQQALDYDPQDSQAYRELGRIHLKANRLEDAARAAAHALQWNKSAENYLFMAQIQIQQGRKSEARDSAATALEIDPANAAASQMFASLQDELTPSRSNR